MPVVTLLFFKTILVLKIFLSRRLEFVKGPVKSGKRHYYLRYPMKSARIAKRKAYEQTDEFKKQYRWRAGFEATMSDQPVQVCSQAASNVNLGASLTAGLYDKTLLVKRVCRWVSFRV
jgi:hypothetical protein